MAEPGSSAPAHPLVARAALVLLLASSAYGAWFWVARDRGPPAESFAKAAAIVKGGYQKEDLVFLLPPYATRAREVLGEVPSLAVADPLAEDLAVHPRLWLFSLFGEAERLAPRLEAAGMKLAKRDTSAPGITVNLWETAAKEQVVYSFLENLRRAKVHHEKDGTDTACAAWTDKNGQGGLLGRWACPYDAEWFYVAPEWHRMGEELRLCLWAHPPTNGRLVITFPDVPLTGQIFGRAGHTANSSRYAHAPVNLDVEVGELRPQRFTFELAETFRAFVLDVPTTGTATVSFAVSSPDAGANHFCFVADARGPR